MARNYKAISDKVAADVRRSASERAAKPKPVAADPSAEQAMNEAYGLALQGKAMGSLGALTRAEKAFLQGSGSGQRQYETIRTVREKRNKGIDVRKFK